MYLRRVRYTSGACSVTTIRTLTGVNIIMKDMRAFNAIKAIDVTPHSHIINRTMFGKRVPDYCNMLISATLYAWIYREQFAQ